MLTMSVSTVSTVSSISVSRLGNSSRLSLSVSRPLAVSVVAMTISIATVSMAISTVSTVISMAVSRLSHDHSEEGERENSLGK